MSYKVNKGVGRSFEFKGLRAAYVFLALGGVIVAILLYFVLGLILPFSLTISLVVIVVLGSMLGAYYLNAHYGEYGYSLDRASRRLPQRVQNHYRMFMLLTKNEAR